ncbi:MAG: DUF4440 domain-containing protein [Steroidobacteraceae bacterium]
MKRLLLVFSILVVGFNVPAASQQDARQAIEAFSAKYTQAYNSKNVPAIVALYTQDAVLVAPWGIITGKEGLQKHFSDVFRNVGTDYVSTTEQIGKNGDASLWAVGSYSVTVPGPNGPAKGSGFWSAVYAMDGDQLKMRLAMFNVTMPPPPQDAGK